MAWLQRYGIDGAYLPFAVKPENLPAALAALPALGLRGVNVTLPHKEAALRLCARVSEAARRIGAVNTIVLGEDGALEGSNTDAFGFLEHLGAASPAFLPAGIRPRDAARRRRGGAGRGGGAAGRRCTRAASYQPHGGPGRGARFGIGVAGETGRLGRPGGSARRYLASGQ